ncbi:MAG: methyltransferase [Defluviitaleaceae bacterium]|nr:methyltransferase [Defluviitaleaceae bacterium]
MSQKQNTPNQYFNENPQALTHERTLTLNIFNRNFSFLSNNGLFSCTKVDEASIILMENLPPLSGTLLDLGCGYGPIGIVLGKTYPLEVTMSDVNRIALDYARKNARRNGVTAQVIHSDGFESLPYKYDNIVLNPPIHTGKEVVNNLYAGAAKHLTPEGALYIVIHKKHGAESTIKTLREIFKKCHILYKKKGLYVLRSCIQLRQ